MIPRINRILDSEQIALILETLLIDCPVKIIRVIARSGRNASSVPWLHFENQLSGDRAATFISFEEILKNFWIWLESIRLTIQALYKRINISKVIWQFVETDNLVYVEKHGWVKVIKKEYTESLGVPRFWIELDKDCGIETIEPCFVGVF